MNERRPVTKNEIIATYALIIGLFLFAAFVGFADIIMLIVLPALLVYSVVRFGYIHLLLQSGALAIIFFVLFRGFSNTILYCILPGALMGICIRRKANLLTVVSVGALSFVAIEAVSYSIWLWMGQPQDSFMQSVSAVSAVAVQELGVSATDVAQILRIISLFMPSVIVLTVAILSYAIYLVARALLSRLDPEIGERYMRFRMLRVSKSALLVGALALVVCILDKGVLGVTAANLALVIIFYIMLCGFALFVYWIGCMQPGIGKALLFIALIWMFSIFSMPALIFGILDAFRDFRNTKKGDSDEE